MMLLIDMGNTAIKAASCTDGVLSPVFREWHRDQDLTVVVDRLLKAVPAPAAIWMSSVLNPSGTSTVLNQLKAHWSCPIHQVKTGSGAAGPNLDVQIAYADPQRLGVDRWLAMIAAKAAYPGDTVIADLGSALTVDVLRADGRHLGGIIVPGLQAMRHGLNLGTALGMSQVSLPDAPKLGVDTESGIAAGALLALAGAVDGAVRIAREMHGLSPQLLITGGDANALATAIHTPAHTPAHTSAHTPAHTPAHTSARIIDDLVLRGLALLSAASST